MDGWMDWFVLVVGLERTFHSQGKGGWRGEDSAV